MTTTQVPAHIQTVRDERAANPVYQAWRLCLDCSMAPDDRHHQPGYIMERSPYDIPGHEYIAPPEPTPPACDCGKGEWCPETGAAFAASNRREPQENRDWAAAHGVDCVECGHGDPVSMAREGCECCDRVRFHDPSGRACALAGMVLRGDAKPGEGECEACISDSVPPMASEVTLGDRRTGTLLIDGAPYAVQRNPGGTHGVWFLLTGPRGAVCGLMPYLDQPSPGVLHLTVITDGKRTPSWAAGKSFLFVAGRLGYIR
jgi:hypothetical protein